MPVLESPRWIQWPLAHLGPEPVGHCFLCRLDPTACVAALEDEEATHAASLIPRDWFLGIALTVGNRPMYDQDGVAFLHFRLCLIGTGLPEYEPASVPIAPSEQRAADRPPIVFEPALPSRWKDLYLHTDYYLLAAFVSRLHYTPGQPVPTLDPAVLQKVHRYRFDDEVDHQDRLVEKERAEQDALQANIELAGATAGSEQAPASSSISSFSGSGSEIVEIKYMLAEEMQTKFSRARFFIEVWLDPASHPEPPTDPAKLAQATAQVEEIWKAWQERMLDETLAKRPQTNEWLRGVEDSGAHEPEEPAQDAEAMFDDDDDILPEDAVDARIEKALVERLNQSQRPLSSSIPQAKVPLDVRDTDTAQCVEPELPAAIVSERPQSDEIRPTEVSSISERRVAPMESTALSTPVIETPSYIPDTGEESKLCPPARQRALTSLHSAASALRSIVYRIKASVSRGVGKTAHL